MTTALPLDAGEIYVHWRIEGGGIGVTAFTDEAGDPYIGLCPLNWNGDPCGPPLYLQRMRLMADIVVGFMSRKPVVVFVDAEITSHGLQVRISEPPHLTRFGHPRHISARWGDPPPTHRMILYPAHFDWFVTQHFKEV
ncbi:MAG: hypothetical protein WCD70_03845 [Alphaproteobacteria bacterium]